MTWQRDLVLSGIVAARRGASRNDQPKRIVSEVLCDSPGTIACSLSLADRSLNVDWQH